MIKDPKTYMKDSPEAAQIFSLAADALIKANYLIAEGKITNLMQTIASERKLYELMRYCCDGLDFAHEFNKSRLSSVSGLTLPKEPKKIVAYVFSLLMEIDTQRILLTDFLDKFYFRESGPYEEYAAFTSELLLPFKRSALSILSSANDRAEKAVSAREETAVPEREKESSEFFESEERELNADAMQELLSVIGAVKETASRDATINAEERAELSLVCDGLYNAVGTKDTRLIRIMFIACKNTVKVSKLFKTLAPMIEVLYKKLGEYNVF